MTEAKPATDEQIAISRAQLAEWEPDSFDCENSFASMLIARIDTERVARLAAEARVKALEKLLDDLDMYLDGPVPWNGDGRLIAEIIRKCRAQGEGVTDATQNHRPTSAAVAGRVRKRYRPRRRGVLVLVGDH